MESKVVSEIEVYLLKHPSLDFQLTMALSPLDESILKKEILNAIIREGISSLMVYPNKINIKLDKNSPKQQPQFPIIIEGIARVKILSISNITEKQIVTILELGKEIVETPPIIVDEDNIVIIW